MAIVKPKRAHTLRAPKLLENAVASQGDQIRSADLLVKTALSLPQTMDELKTDPAGTLKMLSAEAIQQLPRLVPPTPPTNDRIWLVVVASFALVMVKAVVVLRLGVFGTTQDATKQITKSDTMLTVFTPSSDSWRVYWRRATSRNVATQTPVELAKPHQASCRNGYDGHD